MRLPTTTSPSRSLAAVLLALGVLVALVAPATATPEATTSTSTSTATVVKRVTPLTRAGHLRHGYTVAATHKGRCWTSSFENGRLYRCFTGNLIHDPCWKQTGRHSVVCLAVPWGTKVTRIRLTKRLPATETYGPRLWGLRLGDSIDVNCTASQGASGVVNGEGISYYCQRNWALLESPDQSTALWTMDTARWVTDHYEFRGSHHLTMAWKPVVH